MSGVLEHLEALRRMLFKIFSVFAVFCIPGWIFSGRMIDALLRYAAPENFILHYFSVMEPFFVRLEVTMATALIASLPFALIFIWEFVRPALKPEEVRSLQIPIFLMLVLALFGGVVALLGMVPAVINFSIELAGDEFTPTLGIGNFVSLVLGLVLAGMAAFQFPLIVYALLALQVTSLERMKKNRRAVIIMILIVAGILTPPDVASQLLMAIPCYLLFEGALLIYRWRSKKDHVDEK